jgi:glycosyltransferase involved in cell wall biosynthesis
MGRLREPMPLITAVIPVYNAAPYVRTAVESVLRQSCPVHRIIVVDDGSTDDTPALLKSFGGAIEVFRQKNQGGRRGP